VHTVASNLKIWLRGTFHRVTPKHLPRYLDEFSYRFDRRWREDEASAFAPTGRTGRAASLPAARGGGKGIDGLCHTRLAWMEAGSLT
jgi:hypothetical protein